MRHRCGATVTQQSRAVSDRGVLDTLPHREVLAGYAEIVKYGLIDDAPFFEWLEGHGAALVDGDMAARRIAVVKSCEAKARIVSEDERESGRRALLNFGHTFGHALESETGFGDILLHGEAAYSESASLARPLARYSKAAQDLKTKFEAASERRVAVAFGNDKKISMGAVKALQDEVTAALCGWTLDLPSAAPVAAAGSECLDAAPDCRAVGERLGSKASDSGWQCR